MRALIFFFIMSFQMQILTQQRTPTKYYLMNPKTNERKKKKERKGKGKDIIGRTYLPIQDYSQRT